MARVRNTIYAASALSDIIYKYDGHGMEAAFRVPMPNLSPTATYLSTHEDMDFFALEEELNEKGVGGASPASPPSATILFCPSTKPGP